MSNDSKILVVDDEPQVRSMLERYLVSEGFNVQVASGGAAMREIFAKGTVDLVLLDLIMPEEDGLQLARWLREQHSQVGVIMLTSKTDEIDRVVGLEMGADDYIPKPFSLREVLARVKSVLRRIQAISVVPDGAANAGDSRVLRFEGWELDVDRRRLLRSDGGDVRLTANEYELLRAFVEHPNRVLSRDQILDFTQGHAADQFDRSVDVQVKRLRQKVEADPKNPEIIKTVRGAGYIFSAGLRQ